MYSPSENNLDFVSQVGKMCSKSKLLVENKSLVLEPICCRVQLPEHGLRLKRTNIPKRTNFELSMTRYIIILPYVRDEIRRPSQRYADRMEKYPNILATDVVRNHEERTPSRPMHLTSRRLSHTQLPRVTCCGDSS